MQRLLVAGADLRAADPNLPVGDRGRVPDLNWSGCYQVGSGGTAGARELQRRAVGSRTPSASAEEAYAAAATAAFHPDPSAQKELPASIPMIHYASESLQQGRILSAQDVLFLSQLLRCPVSTRKLNRQRKLVPRKVWDAFESNCESTFFNQHDRVCRMVEAALDAFNEGKEFKYTLHVICGVNENVSGPEFVKDEKIRGPNPWTPFKYHHSHINFLATCGESKPTLFFVECKNHGTADGWCIPVESMSPLAGNVRCIYCEYEGSRIVHPAVGIFQGRGVEFVKVLRGEALFYGSEVGLYSNNRIITDNQEEVDWVHSVSDDCIYPDYDDDAPSDDYRDDDYRNDMRMYVPFD